MIAFISFLIAFYIVSSLVFVQLMVENTATEFFTSGPAAVLFHIIFLPEAIVYWIYRLFN